ncbi:hypothetical protein AQUCO_03400252v1 [Aquilegia coerulea]|uniref:Uncharacterized protein n=1 Tax=Aquilegia coerulea TaxID=218851 RepID=A0A2G5CY57_AQUCA|nr:hypothetical protein AQUCO_03400252v1 [Aquilegia coerulea]
MLFLCGFGYWVQGFRCFPWLALNFHMAHTLKLHPSTLQLVQNSANFPMVAKPLYGVLSDALYINGAHRIPYISIGVFLQVLSWGTLALIPVAGETLPTLMACLLVGNLGASITEVAKDALVAEYGQKWKMKSLQSYAFMALAAGGILGNLFGGYFLFKTQQPKVMFLLFTLILSGQLSSSIRTREDSLGLPSLPSHHLVRKSISENLRGQFSNLVTAISEEKISSPLYWIVSSIAVVPLLSGTNFCYQTQYLNVDASIIGMSKVIGQMMLLSAAVLYDRWWKRFPMRNLIRTVQIVYAASLLLDLILVKQYNLKLGISNEVYVLCLSGLSETVAQFKLLPFSVLFAKLCPPGCEGSLTSFLASALCLSSIISGFLGVGLASLIGISAGNYSSLSLGIILQFIAALVPLIWITFVPMYQFEEEKGLKGVRSKRNRRRLKK